MLIFRVHLKTGYILKKNCVEHFKFACGAAEGTEGAFLFGGCLHSALCYNVQFYKVLMVV